VNATPWRREVNNLNPHRLETTDIFRSAFFLCKGGDLCKIMIKDNGKRIATFLIRGKDLDRLDKEYRNGQALVNPLEFRESLNHLRDILFNTLRDPASCEHYAAAKRRTRDDRERKDRRAKKKH
jgi:hypothetical protein